MKTKLYLIIFAMGLCSICPNSLYAQTQNSTVQMGINFNAQTCWQNNFANVCSIGIGQDPTKNIKLEALYTDCAQTTPDYQCIARNWRGHWIDLLYNDGRRYVGIVTIEKNLISMSSQPNTDRTRYTVTVEILDMKKTVAKMNTSFESWDQLPYATLESMPIENGNATTTITLTIDKAFELIIAPSPSPITTPIPSYYPSPMNLKNSSSSLPKARWNILRGQLHHTNIDSTKN